MPVDMPPNKTPPRSREATFNFWMDRSLNWLAVIVFATLCGWVCLLGFHPSF